MLWCGTCLCTHQDVVDFDCASLCIAWKSNEKPSPVSGIANVRHIECCKLDVKELKYIDLWRLVRHSSLPEIYVPVTHLLNTLLEYQKECRISAFVCWMHVATLLKRRASLLWSKMCWQATVVDSVFEMLARVSETSKAQTSMASWHCLKCCSNSHLLDASWPFWPLWLYFWMDPQLKK